MAEQSGSGRYPKPPASQAWEGTSPDGANDPNQGNFGSPWSEAPGKESSTKAGSENGNAKSVPSPTAGSNFSGGPSGEGTFEQGEMPSTEINYHSF